MSKFTGAAAFGCAYQIMMERDAHATGSVDRVSGIVGFTSELGDGFEVAPEA